MSCRVSLFAVPAAVALTLTACSGSAAHHSTGQIVQVSVSNCGRGWTGRTAGTQTMTMRDTDSRAGDVQVIDARSGAVYAEIDPIGPGASQQLHVSLSAGHYAVRCVMEDEPAVTGTTVTLTGPAHGDTPGVLPVAQGDLITATQSYQRYVTSRLPVLLHDTQEVQSDIESGALDAARRDWLPAQLAYLSIGAAYSAFGDEDAEIDGRADGLPDGVADKDWHGLLRLQYGLWHGQSAASLRPVATALVRSVQTLQREFPKAQIDPRDISIRAHEITEDAVGFALTGRDDYGAHAALAEVAQDVDATRTVLEIIEPLLRTRYRGLPDLRAQLTTTTADLTATRRGGAWPALQTLPQATHERVDADVSRLAELLAPVAAILEPRRTS